MMLATTISHLYSGIDPALIRVCRFGDIGKNFGCTCGCFIFSLSQLLFYIEKYQFPGFCFFCAKLLLDCCGSDAERRYSGSPFGPQELASRSFGPSFDEDISSLVKSAKAKNEVVGHTFSATAYAVALRWELGSKGRMLMSTILNPTVP